MIEAMIEVFGFTTVENTIWKSISYVGFVVILVGIIYERYQKPLFFWGPLLLAVYAGFFLHDPLIAVCQALITLAGFMRLVNITQRTLVVTMVSTSIVATSILAGLGSISTVTDVLGLIGLLGIVAGFVLLPRACAFLAMFFAAMFLVVYAYNVGAWVFFWLNIAFVFANVHTYRKVRDEEKLAHINHPNMR